MHQNQNQNHHHLVYFSLLCSFVMYVMYVMYVILAPMLVPNVPFILSNKNRDKLLCCWFSLCAGTESSARFCSGLFCGLAGAIWRRQGELGGTLWPNKAELARIAQESCLCSRHKAQRTKHTDSSHMAQI